MLSSVTSVSAQTDSEKKYLIEVIVFENTGPDSADNELFGRRIELALDEPTPTGDPLSEKPDFSFVQAGTLGEITADLKRSSRYDLLKQVAWIQPAVNKGDAPKIYVGKQAELTGQVRFYSKKLLFIEVELRFHRPLKSITNITVPYSSRHYQTPVYIIKETRRLKLNNIHYFDHPHFGALVKVSRWSQQP